MHSESLTECTTGTKRPEQAGTRVVQAVSWALAGWMNGKGHLFPFGPRETQWREFAHGAWKGIKD